MSATGLDECSPCPTQHLAASSSRRMVSKVVPRMVAVGWTAFSDPWFPAGLCAEGEGVRGVVADHHARVVAHGNLGMLSASTSLASSRDSSISAAASPRKPQRLWSSGSRRRHRLVTSTKPRIRPVPQRRWTVVHGPADIAVPDSTHHAGISCCPRLVGEHL